jgi:hypothetical protein
MNVAWWIPWSLGFQDGINPYAVLACAIVLTARLWLERRGLQPKKFLVILIASAFILNLLLSAGVFFGIVSTVIFQKTMLVLYLGLALGFIAAGAVFFYDWALWLNGKDPQTLLSGRMSRTGAVSRGRWEIFAVIVLGVVVSFIGTLWPPDAFITVVSNNIFIPGQFWPGMKILAMYTAAALWLPVFFMVLSLWHSLTPRLRQVIYAAVFLSAGTAVLYSK